MQNKKLLFSFVSFVLAATAVVITTVKSQNAQTVTSGLSVSPPTFEITGNAGDTISNVVRLENVNEFPVKIAVDRRNFTAIGEEGAIGLTEDSNSYSIASWITVEPDNLVIPAKTSKTFKYDIKIPLNAEPGGHFGSIIFRTIPEEMLDGSGATLAQEIGSLILLKIAGATTEEAKIESFNASSNFSEYGPINFVARVSNLGNVHIKPTGTISINNIFGQKVGTVALDSKNVLPGAIRHLDGVWDTKWRMGRYTATLVMVYGKDVTTRAAITNFIVFPYRLAIIVLVILLIIGTLLYKSRRRLSLAWKILTSGKA